MSWLWRMLSWFWRKKPTDKNWEFPAMEDFELPRNLSVFLMAFSYDSATGQLATWFHKVLTSRNIDQSRVLRFSNDGGDIKGVDIKEELTMALQDKTVRVELFCGHGIGTGLLGPPRLQVVGSILSDRSFVVYDTEMITETPSSLFAFCCFAARRFGRVFASYNEKQFMGFDDEIPFPVDLYEDMKYVFHSVSKDIIISGRISQSHGKMFLEKIDEIASQAHLCRNPKLVRVWLHSYQKRLRVYA